MIPRRGDCLRPKRDCPCPKRDWVKVENLLSEQLVLKQTSQSGLSWELGGFEPAAHLSS